MSSSPRVVCWLNRKEWLDVYQCLFDFHNPQLQRKGLDRVLAWKSRSGGKLPLAIESTADLVLANLTDAQSNSFTTEKQLILSMALVRFVNGMADMNQRGVYARSVHSIAEEIGLPDWLVDLRHEATHASLPSQDTLRAGIKVALSWLQEEYWEAQVKTHKVSEQNLTSLIKKYLDVAVVRKTKKKNIEKQALKVQSLAEDVASFVSSNNLWSYLQVVLLKQDFQNYIQEDDETDTIESESVQSCVSEELIKVWLPLFQALDKESCEFITLFVLSALEAYSDSSTTIARQCLSWVLWIIKSSTKNNPIFESELPWLTLLEVCLRSPSFLQIDFVEMILDEAPIIPDIQKEKIRSLVGIFQEQNSVGHFPEENFEMKSINVFQEQQGVIDQNTDTSISLQDSSWSLDQSQTKWDLISIGEILGCDEQSVDALELAVSDDCNQHSNLKQTFENESEGEEEGMDVNERESDSDFINDNYINDDEEEQEEVGSAKEEPEKLEIVLF